MNLLQFLLLVVIYLGVGLVALTALDSHPALAKLFNRINVYQELALLLFWPIACAWLLWRARNARS